MVLLEWKSRVTSGVWAQVWFMVLSIISQVPKCLIGMNIVRNWLNPHFGCLACGIRT